MPPNEMNAAIPEGGPATEEISGLIERVTCHNEDSGFCVLRVKTPGRRDETTVIGSLPSVTAGEWLVAEGSFANGMRNEWTTWLVANRTEIVPALNLLNRVITERPKKVTVIGGTDIPLPRTRTDWIASHSTPGYWNWLRAIWNSFSRERRG